MISALYWLCIQSALGKSKGKRIEDPETSQKSTPVSSLSLAFESDGKVFILSSFCLILLTYLISPHLRWTTSHFAVFSQWKTTCSSEKIASIYWNPSCRWSSNGDVHREPLSGCVWWWSHIVQSVVYHYVIRLLKWPFVLCVSCIQLHSMYGSIYNNINGFNSAYSLLHVRLWCPRTIHNSILELE